MYKAIVTRIEVTPHPNADLIAVGHVAGHTIVVSKGTVSGDLGIFFPSDGCLTPTFCLANDLYPRFGPQGERVGGGFFDPKNNRVRAQSFRGVKSEGYWCPIKCLLEFANYIGNGDVAKAVLALKEGDTFDELADVRICEKYYTPATKAARESNGEKTKTVRRAHPLFHKHVDTEQLKYGLSRIPLGSTLTITEKLHGMSGRYAYLESKVDPPKFGWIKNKFFTLACWILQLLGVWKRFEAWQWTLLTGSRTIETDPNTYDTFRQSQALALQQKLHHNEIIYGEFVGFYTPAGKPLMNRQSVSKLKDPKFEKTYGKVMTYAYGCTEEHPWDFYVYRIAMVNQDSSLVELSHPQLKARAKELGLKVVPELVTLLHDGSREKLAEIVASLADGPSTLDPSHIREGVVVRVDSPEGNTYFLKEKSFNFKVLEGHAKDDSDYVDAEEIA